MEGGQEMAGRRGRALREGACAAHKTALDA